jgi:signal transduction histidine kinase
LLASVGVAMEWPRVSPFRREPRARADESALGFGELTAVATHELASSLAVIRVCAEALAEPSLGEPERARMLEGLRGETDVMTGLLADVRAMAAGLQDGFAVHPVPVDLRHLLADADIYARSLRQRHPFRVRGEADGCVLADPDRIGQVFRNLIGNAAKFSPAEAPIEVRVARDGDRIRFAVVDHGPGVAEEDAERIFQPFTRGRRRDPRVPGTGLGLHIARQIVRAHGGALTVEPTPGSGAAFRFDLPAAGPPRPGDPGRRR